MWSFAPEEHVGLSGVLCRERGGNGNCQRALYLVHDRLFVAAGVVLTERVRVSGTDRM